jgi:hypothetical protein
MKKPYPLGKAFLYLPKVWANQNFAKSDNTNIIPKPMLNQSYPIYLMIKNK